MPRPSNYVEPPADPALEAFLALHREFKNGFQRSAKGNLWREWEGDRVSVFRRGKYRYVWCVAENYKERYSRDRFDSEEDALDALAYELLRH